MIASTVYTTDETCGVELCENLVLISDVKHIGIGQSKFSHCLISKEVVLEADNSLNLSGSLRFWPALCRP